MLVRMGRRCDTILARAHTPLGLARASPRSHLPIPPFPTQSTGAASKKERERLKVAKADGSISEADSAKLGGWGASHADIAASMEAAGRTPDAIDAHIAALSKTQSVAIKSALDAKKKRTGGSGVVRLSVAELLQSEALKKERRIAAAAAAASAAAGGGGGSCDAAE